MTAIGLNQAYLKEADQKVRELETEIASLSRIGKRATDPSSNHQPFEQSNRDLFNRRRLNGSRMGAPRMAELQDSLTSESFSPAARQLLAQIDVELKAIGYDAAAHDACRHQEAASRSAEGEFRALESARAALQPLQREIDENLRSS